MKARVDSGEFSTAVKVASRWTATTGLEATKSVILEAVDNWLLVRTTTGDQDCQLAVNAFDVEPGKAVTGSQMLISFAFDSGGWLRLHDTKTKLILDYEDFSKSRIGLLADEVIDLFPTFIDVGESMQLDSQTLLIAGNHTMPVEKTGMPIKSAVHVIPQGNGKVVIMGTDGVVGYARELEAEIPSILSIDSKLLSDAISAIGEHVLISASDHRVQVSSPNSPSKIQFSTTASTDPTKIVDMFKYDVPEEPIEITQESMKRMRFLCSRAASVDESAEIRVSDGEFEILGHEVAIEKSSLAEGSIPEIVFRCDSLARALSHLSSVEKYLVWPMSREDKPFWYIDGIGRHFMMGSAPVRFAEQTAE